jgi:hypothetical protein
MEKLCGIEFNKPFQVVGQNVIKFSATAVGIELTPHFTVSNPPTLEDAQKVQDQLIKIVNYLYAEGLITQGTHIGVKFKPQ